MKGGRASARRVLRPFSALVLACLSLAGCAGAAPPAAVQIEAHYSRFTPSTVTVSAGDAVRFVLRNHDPIAHEWIVGDDAVHAHHRDGTEPAHGDRPTEQGLPALGFVRTTVTFDEPGEYRFICHLPGHEAYGMAGTIVVTGG